MPYCDPFSGHGAARSAQRVIPLRAVDLLLEYGICTRSRGADRYFFDQAGRRRLQQDLGDLRFREVERWLDIYAVVADDGTIITVAWRTRRLRRH
jgi:hypothetical protein